MRNGGTYFRFLRPFKRYSATWRLVRPVMSAPVSIRARTLLSFTTMSRMLCGDQLASCKQCGLIYLFYRAHHVQMNRFNFFSAQNNPAWVDMSSIFFFITFAISESLMLQIKMILTSIWTTEIMSADDRLRRIWASDPGSNWHCPNSLGIKEEGVPLNPTLHVCIYMYIYKAL